MSIGMKGRITRSPLLRTGAILTVALAVLTLWTSSGHAGTRAPVKVLDFLTGADVAKAEQEGEVVYYSHDSESGISTLLEAFKKDFSPSPSKQRNLAEEGAVGFANHLISAIMIPMTVVMLFMMTIVSFVVVSMSPSFVFVTIVPFVIFTSSAPSCVIRISSNANLGHKVGFVWGSIKEIMAKDRLQEEYERKQGAKSHCYLPFHNASSCIVNVPAL